MTDHNQELVEDFLRELDGWESAYPLSSFPEPDLKKAHRLLKAGGMTLDAISASNMRHVISCLAPKARAAIAAAQADGVWQPIESPPPNGTAVVVLRGNDTFETSFGPIRDFVERCELGWFEDGDWWQAGTGHDMFEPWRVESGHVPTHWTALSAPEPVEEK